LAGDDPAMIAYHDREWGVPVHDDRDLFEFLILEGAQAGLSWSTILKKRAAYRTAFDNLISTRARWRATTTPKSRPCWPTRESCATV
jgi:DNA-3-methyladenine glycosylase I